MMTAALTVAVAVACGQSPEAPVDPGLLARVRAYEQARIQVIERLMPTVVCMFHKGSRAGGGSGVIIDPEGYGLTNFHVVAGMLGERVGEGGLADHELYPFDVLGIDPTGDIAMFKLHRPEPFDYAPLGSSDALRIGDYTLAMGNPFLLAEDYTPTVTLGIVSGTHRYQWGQGRALRYTDCIQVDTSINPGNSGGPLFDLAGELVGINGRVSLEDRGRINVGVGYAISIDQVKRFIPTLRAGLPTKHATAGFTVFDRGRKVIVDQILDDSAAYRAGIRLGDQIVEFGGKGIRSANQFTSLLGVYPGGWPVDVVFRRQDTRREVRFRLEDLPFPKSRRRPGARGDAPDPYAPHPVTRAANRRAVKRAFDRFRRSPDGKDAFASIRSIRAIGKRTLAGDPLADPQPVDETNARPSDTDPGVAINPALFEKSLWWALMDPGEDPAKRGFRVVAADEVRGRITVVIERKADDATDYRVAFDDAGGRLLRIEFRDPASGRVVRYEYGDYRRVGHVKLPHTRRLYLDDELYAEDRFDEVTISSEAP